MAEAKAAHKDAMERFIALQFLFDKQWKAVKVGGLQPAHSLCMQIVLFPHIRDPASAHIHRLRAARTAVQSHHCPFCMQGPLSASH